jgi:4-hydroxythreonine-4-phosphate dehydrogenase
MSPRGMTDGAARPRIAVTMGDPAGVGPEVALRASAEPGVQAACDLRMVGSRSALVSWARRLSLPEPAAVVDPGRADVSSEPGRPTEAGARAAIAAIEEAARMCRSGEAEAMVTGPVSKSAIAALGYDFPGHTEFLAALTGTRHYVMTFIDGPRRVGLATTHLPLSHVPGALTRELIVSKLRVLEHGLADWLGVAGARIAVAALNPHAGEGGRFGTEEERVIVPAIEEAQAEGIRAEGPFAADALFAGLGRPAGQGPGSGYDAALAMYHDQGTIAIKHDAFDRAVNLTLGLPIVRTSVDHGTAFGIAGTAGVAHGSMVAAVLLAASIAGRLGRGGPRSGVSA